MSELTTEEMAIIIATAIGASVSDIAAALPHMPLSERETILSEAQTLNALQGRIKGTVRTFSKEGRDIPHFLTT